MELYDIKQELLLIRQKMTPMAVDVTSVDLVTQMPVDNVEDFKKLNVEICEEEKFSCFVSMITYSFFCSDAFSFTYISYCLC